MQKYKKILLAGALAFSLFLTSGCGKNENVTKETNEDTEPTINETKKISIVDELSTSRPYAVMINNESYYARPVQSGLQDAFIIYEIIVEGGITRYMALFMDQTTERIGTVRSARHYFLDYALENDAIYVHHGKSPQAQSDFTTLNVDRIEINDSVTGWRDKTLKTSSGKSYPTEHTLYTSIAKLDAGIGSKRTTRNQDLLLNYSADEIDTSKLEGAIKADEVIIKYSSSTTSSYVYDEENGYYLRSVNGKSHTDYVTKEQYHFKNIIAYDVKNYDLDDSENKGRQGLDNIGSGTGYFISNGYAVPIKWEKTSRESQTKYTYNDGTQITVNDGNTFIQIYPKTGKLTIS
jgi:hypothetical protein